MRQNEERVAAVKHRIVKLKAQKRRNQLRFIAISSVAACFAIIVGLSTIMPQLMTQLGTGWYADYKMAASVFNDGSGLGFVLGVAFTILCERLHRMERDRNETEDDDGRTH